MPKEATLDAILESTLETAIEALLPSRPADSIANIKTAALPPGESLEPAEKERSRLLWREAGRRVCIEKHEGKKHRRDLIDPKLSRDLKCGWLLPYLLQYDSALWGRWDYLCEAIESGQLPDSPIPQIEWDNHLPFGGVKNNHIAGGIGYKHISDCLDLVENCGRLSWTGWSSFSNIDYFLEWLLYGFGCIEEEPREPSKGASMRLYQFFDLAVLQAWPWDYWGDLLADQSYGRRLGFFPTPFPVVQLMTSMIFANKTGDHRAESFNEPCMGTGRILMVASNYCMDLSGADISGTMVKCTLVNGYLYSPWMVKPLPFLSKSRRLRQADSLGGECTSPPEPTPAPAPEPTPAPAPDCSADIEPGWQSEPIMGKGDKRGVLIGDQGSLF
jgi:hypothetical protein